jgi:23S rRNA U2552 (ribose-2'-O)-methylase RlmE/FtsJ
MNLLTQIADKYTSDKGSKVALNPLHPPHNFASIYNNIFESIRFDVKNVLEIGVFQGGSLRMWEEYFPNAKIYGVDYDPRNIYNSDRVKTFVFDQSDKKAIQNMMREIDINFDIIIDDGSHDIFDQQKTFLYMFEFLLSKGFYIIEDLHSSTDLYASWFLDKYNIDEKCSLTTLNILQTWQATKKFLLPYFDKHAVNDLERQIESVDIYDIRGDRKSITSIIRKI